ncbi:hypothetical protein [Parasphingorhabdus sp.]|uniref:hypothetical protein n=1 Tax=Parasphingorhabdus sp. TaxID=2709688 RepID=UPI002B2755B6|nr:hypothetical protein [Parasphingorhabdus sp.]
MDESDIFPFPLYHGTSSWYLPSIIEHGLGCLNVHEHLRSRDFLRDTWKLRLELADSEQKSELMNRPSSMISAMIEDRVTNGGFNFRYGQTYCTGEERKAVSYASNSCGSELISEATGLLAEIREVSVKAAAELILQYPEMAGCLAFQHEPIVLCLDGVAHHYVRMEGGGPLTPELDAIAGRLSFELLKGANFSTMSVFRVKNITKGCSGPEGYDLVPHEEVT